MSSVKSFTAVQQGVVMSEKALPSYFSVTSVLLLLLSVIAFSDNLFTDVGQPSNSDLKFIVHGLFGLAWYVLLATQANLVRLRNLKLHRQLGIATFIVSIGVILSTLYVFIAVWKGWSNMGEEARANRLLLPGFTLFILLAWLLRRRSDWHKRLLFAGTFLMLGPLLTRSYDKLVMSWAEPMFPSFYTKQVDEAAFLTYFCAVWASFFLSLAFYDWKDLRRIHPVTIAGCAWLVLAWLISALT